MARERYTYKAGNAIELLGYCDVIGSIRAAVVQAGKVRFEGTMFQALKFLADEGDAMAQRQCMLYMAALNDQAKPRIRRRDARRSFFNRRGRGRR